ncbi:hypothetical protein HY493_01080 [Candidatus Woesearchaeota archaeon]|nr:hypothetical protein [Candidatus Woesearchaeota archaeon]
MIALREAGHALKTAFSQPLVGILSSLSDAVFLLVYGFLARPVRDNLLIDANNLVQTLAGALRVAGERFETPSMMQLIMTPEARPHTMGIAFWLAVLGVLAYVLYVLFQSAAWKLARGTLSGTGSWKDHLARFAAVNIPWFLILGVLTLTRDIIDLRSALVLSMTKTPGWTVPAAVYYALIGIVVYFMLISYSEIHRHSWRDAFTHSFRKGVKEFGSIAPAFLLIVLALVVIQVLLQALATVNEALWFVAGVALILPFLYWARIYIIRIGGMTHDVREQP